MTVTKNSKLAVPKQTSDARPVPGKNDVLLVAMNNQPQLEASFLAKRGSHVSVISDSFQQGKIRQPGSAGVVHDLTSDEGLEKFVSTLNLPEEQSREVLQAMNQVEPDARDELGRLALVFGSGERGGSIPSRLVLSGHHIGSSLFGDGNGRLSWESLESLGKAMPAAAAQVRHVMLAACSSGSESKVEQFLAIFPKLETLWAYSGSAPGAASGAEPHLVRWELATRGPAPLLRRELAEKTRKGENVVVWSRQGGYDDGKPRAAVGVVIAASDQRLGDFDRYFRGEAEVEDPQAGPLREYYASVQTVLQQVGLEPEVRSRFEMKRDQAIRLLFYRNIARKFVLAHSELIRDGYAELKRAAPDFARLPRGQALAEIERLVREVAAANPPPQSAGRLTVILKEGLGELRPERIPDEWI